MIGPDSWLQSHYGAEVFRAGLEPLEIFLSAHLEHIKNQKTKIITVAGTNGKGETSLRFGQILAGENKTYKLWTSPHLISVCERFKSEKGDISEEELLALFVATEKKKTTSLSYYEFLFSVFIEWVAEGPCDYLILEVGLGGRLDAVSLLPPDLTLIPSISRDHQEYLGTTYKSILFEKLGVTRKASEGICVSSFELNYLSSLSADFFKEKIQYLDLFNQGVVSKDEHFSSRNTTLALYGHKLLNGIKPQASELKTEVKSLLSHQFSGRGEDILLGDKKITFFGSHNPDGVRKLIHLLKSNNYTFNEILVSFSARDQKDLITQLKLIGMLGKEKVILTSFSHPKAAPNDLLESLATKEGIRFVKEWPHILHTDSTTCLVTGSYYFVGAVQSYIRSLRG